jgi:thiosulfate dehydrogenase
MKTSMRPLHRLTCWLGLSATVLLSAPIVEATEPAQKKHEEHKVEAQTFVHGRPEQPTEAWLRAAGGRIYDNWWDALDRKKPEGTHPTYPASGTQTGAGTWRCKECHGWDYKGRDGLYGAGDHKTGFPGIRNAQGRSVADIVKLLRAPRHGYTQEMMNDEEIERIAVFVSRGQHDADRYVDRTTGKVKGDVENGRAVFQTVCAACHGFDGKLFNWGTRDAPAYVGTEADKFPAEVLHKIRNSHPGAAMVNLRSMPFAASVDVLAFARTLPTK